LFFACLRVAAWCHNGKSHELESHLKPVVEHPVVNESSRNRPMHRIIFPLALACLMMGIGACSSTDAPSETTSPRPTSEAEAIAWQWNTHCPISGKPVVRDDLECSFEHEGIRVYFCNPHCASDSAKEPEVWIAKAYPDGPP
jgi:YHS domain-containing protein